MGGHTCNAPRPGPTLLNLLYFYSELGEAGYKDANRSDGLMNAGVTGQTGEYLLAISQTCRQHPLVIRAGHADRQTPVCVWTCMHQSR